MVVAAKELDVVVALVEVESQIASALRAFQIAAKGAGLLCYGTSGQLVPKQTKQNALVCHKDTQAHDVLLLFTYCCISCSMPN